MIGRLSGRLAFGRLRSEGKRLGRGPIRLVFRPDTTQSANVAFAIPRNVGNAVARNRTKRRLRAVLNDLDSRSGGLEGGDYLLRVTSPIETWSHSELQETMAELLLPSKSSTPRVPR